MDDPFVDPEWGTIKYFKVARYNRTASGIKALIILAKDFPDNVMVSIT